MAGLDPRAIALNDKIEKHPLTKANIEWKAVGRVYRAYQRNAAEFLVVLSDPQRNPQLAIGISMMDQRHNVRENYFDEVYRLLHNYLASVKTLVEHTRTLVKRYPGTSFKSEYERRLEAITTAGVTVFLHKMRNYLLHSRFPPLEVNTRWTRESGQIEFTTTLDKDLLLEWGDWSHAAKAYINRETPLILSESVEEYAALLEELYEWLFAQFKVVHAKDILEVDAMVEEARELLDWDPVTNGPRRPTVDESAT